MMNFVWLNIPLAAVAVLATIGIPAWLVIKHPEQEPVTVAA
jgi:hypothetical protein